MGGTRLTPRRQGKWLCAGGRFGASSSVLLDGSGELSIGRWGRARCRWSRGRGVAWYGSCRIGGMGDGFEPASSEHAMRMGHALVLNVLVLVSAWRFVRGMGVGDSIQRVVDAVLLWLGVQYACVTVCGVVGVLNAWTMTVAAVVACGTMWATAGRRRVGEALSYIPPHLDRPKL